MTITSYTALQSAISDWVERSDLTTRLPTFIANAEAKGNRILRDRRQQAQDTASITTQFSALPTDFAEAITVQARLNASEAWTHLDPTPSDVLAQYDAGGSTTIVTSASTARPRFWTTLGTQLGLYPTPDQAYTIKLTYYTLIPALSDTNTSNWLLAAAPDVYLDGSLAGFYEFDRDFEAANRYLQKFEAGLAELLASRRTPVGRLRMEPGLVRPRLYDITRDI